MIRIACTAIAKRINAGRVNKAGTAFIGDPVDVTGDCLKAVIEKIGVGQPERITVDGVPTFEISIRDLRAPVQAQGVAPYGYVLKTGHGNSFRETLDGVAPEAWHMWVAVERMADPASLAQAPQSDDARDAARYRFVRSQIDYRPFMVGNLPLDESIDSRIAAIAALTGSAT